MAEFITYLAKTTDSLSGQRILLNYPSHYSSLAENLNLHESVWEFLYSKKLDVETTEKLVSRSLNSAQIDLVLAKEKRINVLKKLVKYSKLSEEQGTLLCAKQNVYLKIVQDWWSGGKVPTPLQRKVAEDSKSMIEYAYENKNFSDSVILQILETYTHNSSVTLLKIVEERPKLVDALITSNNYLLRVAAAQSRHLFNQDLMVKSVEMCGIYENYITYNVYKVVKSLIENPNTSPKTLKKLHAILDSQKYREPSNTFNLHKLITNRLTQSKLYVTNVWEDERDLSKIKLINSYAGKNEVRLNTVRDLPNLLLKRKCNGVPVENFNLLYNNLKVINYSKVEVKPYRIPDEGVKPTVNWLSNELDSYGLETWEAALMLLSSSFQGKLEDLVHIARNI